MLSKISGLIADCLVHNISVKLMKRLALIGLSIMMLIGANTEVVAATNACHHPSFHVYSYRESIVTDCGVLTGCKVTTNYNCTDEICNECGLKLSITKVYAGQTHSKDYSLH